MTTSLPVPRKLWEHPSPHSTQLWKFMKHVESTRRVKLESFRDVYTWSVDSRLDFWQDVFNLLPVIHSGKYDRVTDADASMDKVPKWFEGVRLNFAENLLFEPSPTDPSKPSDTIKHDSKIALTEVREGGTEIRHVSWKELRARVGLLSNALRNHGVTVGDRVAVVASNSVDTLSVFLATATLGAIFSSSSTDMGTKGVLDRLLQIKPKFVFVDDWAIYNGKTIDLRPKMAEIEAGVRGIAEFQALVFLPRFRARPASVSSIPKSITLDAFEQKAKGDAALRFTRLDFNDPFLIVYSSGTTGVPKCIMHSIGGTLLNSTKEGRLHRDIGPSTTQLQYTTTGWIMYLSSVMSLNHGARVVLYDGSPFLPDLTAFVSLVSREKVTDLGISPRYLQTLATATILPRDRFDLSALRRVTSTGMVLPEALFEWFYDAGFPPHVQLANISGGTDIAGCFAIENPLSPVYVGGCAGPGLGLKVEVYDQTIEGDHVTGRPVATAGDPGELVCTRAFPNQPPRFFGDPDGKKYQAAYYGRFRQVWTHGDFIYIHPVTGGVYFLGRADGVLNPSGVRFGSAEIYNVIETFFRSEIADSLCVGQRRRKDTDENVMLFLKMQDGAVFDDALVAKVKSKIGEQCSKRHVPSYVFQTWDIPTTVNLKKVELPVKRIVSGEKIKPSGTLLNPESLDYYYRFVHVEALEGQPKLQAKL